MGHNESLAFSGSVMLQSTNEWLTRQVQVGERGGLRREVGKHICTRKEEKATVLSSNR